jgi:hypothetical protein
LKAIIRKKTTLHEVHSASGMEIVNEKISIIGDDSKWLYYYDTSGNLLEKHLLFESIYEDRIPKKEKPDLETLTSLTINGKTYLLALGSGSKKILRDKGFLIDIDTNNVTALDLTFMYSNLRNCADVVGEKTLNVEGLAATNDTLVLFTRGNISGKNLTLTYDLRNFLNHLSAEEKLREPSVHSFDLPSINNWLSGFSGATYSSFHKSFLFASTVESTLNEIDDGETLGSFIGLIENSNTKRLKEFTPIIENNRSYLGKVESISILKESESEMTILAVTDSDGGESELLEIEVVL